MYPCMCSVTELACPDTKRVGGNAGAFHAELPRGHAKAPQGENLWWLELLR